MHEHQTAQQATPSPARQVLELTAADTGLQNAIGTQRDAEQAVTREVAVVHLATGVADEHYGAALLEERRYTLVVMHAAVHESNQRPDPFRLARRRSLI